MAKQTEIQSGGPVTLQAEQMLGYPNIFKAGRRASLVAIGAFLTGCGALRNSSRIESTFTTTLQPTEVVAVKTTTTTSSRRGLVAAGVNTFSDSRDRLRDGVNQAEIDHLVSKVAEVGATHISLGTPYDDGTNNTHSFLPALESWVRSARAHDLKVWFRGNFSAWEGWYSDMGFQANMTIEQHVGRTQQFILAHPDLFEDGDIFCPCPEPENGAAIINSPIGLQALNDFLPKSYNASQSAFQRVGKNVKIVFSSNGDVAAQLPQPVVRAIGNIIGIDHYVADASTMGTKIDQMLSNFPGVELYIPEFGAPIPGINHSDMTEGQKITFAQQLFDEIAKRDVRGIG